MKWIRRNDWIKRSISLVALAVTGSYVQACSNEGSVDPLPDDSVRGVVISNSRTSLAPAPSAGGNAFFSATASGISYISLVPGTLPNATKIQIANRTQDHPVSLFSLVDGGLDPVAVQATEGDTLELTPLQAGGPLASILIKVPRKRPPTIVRTTPGKGRTDVALNVIVSVIFSEPVDPRTVNSTTVQLLRNGAPVGGRLELQSDSWDVDFHPDNALEMGATYQLVITEGVRDLDGDPLETSYSSTFVTGSTLCTAIGGDSGCPTTGGTNIITGTVSERIGTSLRPMPNARVRGWVQKDGETGYGVEEVADAAGTFTIRSLPDATVRLLAIVAGYDQPCAATVELASGEAKVEIEVVRSVSPFPDAATALPRVSGTTAELVPLNPTTLLFTPVGGVRIYVELPRNFTIMTTTSNDLGRYAFCRVPQSELLIFAVKAGFPLAERSLTVPVSSPDFTYDIELKR